MDAWYKALKLDPGQTAALGNLSAVCLAQKRYHECRWLCRKALARITDCHEKHTISEDIVDKLEVRLERAELKIKESSVEESAFPPYVPGSLPGKCVDDTLVNINGFSNELVHYHPQVGESDSSPAGHFTPGT